MLQGCFTCELVPAKRFSRQYVPQMRGIVVRHWLLRFLLLLILLLLFLLMLLLLLLALRWHPSLLLPLSCGRAALLLRCLIGPLPLLQQLLLLGTHGPAHNVQLAHGMTTRCPSRL
jgi:hypothetical protein